MKAKEKYRIKKRFPKKSKKALQKGINDDFLKSNAIRMLQEPTTAEQTFMKILDERGIPYEAQVAFKHEGHRYIFDFLVVKKWVVEIDGGYHNESKQKNKDKKRDEYLTEFGFKIRRFTNAEVLKYSKNLHNWLNGIYCAYHIKEKNEIKEKMPYKVKRANIEAERLDNEFLEMVNDKAS